MTSNEPARGAKSKNEPHAPNHRSTSGKSEQYEPYVALHGDAKHSCAHDS